LALGEAISGKELELKSNLKRAILISYADLTSRHFRVEVAGLERLLFGRSELLLLVDCDHPEAGHRLVVVTLTLSTVALDEWSCAEVLQARSRTREGLTTTTMSNSSML
jgi:hypothetical protein